MAQKKINLLVAVTGASGSIYAKHLLNKLITLKPQTERIAVVFTECAESVWKHELDSDPYEIPFTRFRINDFFTPPASGSGLFNTMIIIPASMGTMAAVANGMANNLVARAADVMLKERNKLIVVPREMPYNLIHIKNMEKITLAGGIICPASPSFYSGIKAIEEAVDTVVSKVLKLAGFQFDSFAWGEEFDKEE